MITSPVLCKFFDDRLREVSSGEHVLFDELVVRSENPRQIG